MQYGCTDPVARRTERLLTELRSRRFAEPPAASQTPVNDPVAQRTRRELDRLSPRDPDEAEAANATVSVNDDVESSHARLRKVVSNWSRLSSEAQQIIVAIVEARSGIRVPSAPASAKDDRAVGPAHHRITPVDTTRASTVSVTDSRVAKPWADRFDASDSGCTAASVTARFVRQESATK